MAPCLARTGVDLSESAFFELQTTCLRRLSCGFPRLSQVPAPCDLPGTIFGVENLCMARRSLRMFEGGGRRFRGMTTTAARARAQHSQFPKAPTGIQGLDEVTGGGLPRGRPTLVCGGAGCGKTLLAMEFLVRGAVQFGEPGVVLTFEETGEELAQNVRSLGFDLNDLVE